MSLAPSRQTFTRLLAGGLTCGLALACSTTGSGPAPAPGWFANPPNSASTLYFVGEASDAPDEDSARELAIQKALYNLSVFVGAKVTSEASSQVAESKAGVDQVVQMSVEVEGEQLEVQRLEIEKIVLQPGTEGGVNGYAMVAWPKSEYERVIAGRKNQAERALSLYYRAKDAADAHEDAEARAKLSDARALLGDSVAVVPLDDSAIRDSGVLRSELAALEKALEARGEDKARVCAVAVRCTAEGKEAQCDPSLASPLRKAVQNAGLALATNDVASDVIAAILDSNAPEVDTQLRSVGCIVVTQFDSKTLAEERGVLFIRYSARSAVFDPQTRRVQSSYEVPEGKEGFPIFDGRKSAAFEGATRKGFGQAKAKVESWLTSTLGGES